MVTATNNSGAGQPVSVESLRAVRAVCDRAGAPLWLHACRFAESERSNREREPGQSGRHLEAIAQGLAEAVSHDYLRHRIRSTARLGEALDRAGVAVVLPIGSHAVYLDTRARLPRLPDRL